MEDEEIYYDGQLPEVEVLSQKGAKKAYEKRVKQEMRKSKKDYKKMLSDYERSSSEGTYLAELINHVSAHPESLFAKNQRAADARRWLIDNDHEEVLDWAFDRSNPNARKLFNSKYLTLQSLTQLLVDDILDGQNKAGKTAGLTILAGASIPLLAEALPSVTSFATKAFWNPFSSMARGKSAQWGLNHIINPVLRKAGLGEMSQQALVGAGRVADIATIHIPAYKSTYNDIAEKVKGNRNWFINKYGDFSLFNTVNTTTAPLFAFGAAKEVQPITKAVSNTVKSVKPLARDVWSIARNNMTKGNTRLAYPWEKTNGSVVDVTDMQGNKAIDRTMKFISTRAKAKPRLNEQEVWRVANYPGYLLKGLMSGSPLEKSLSKLGTISINSLNAYFNKASQVERDVVNKVLAEKFAGLKTIDYNLLKKAVLEELIGSYDRVPLTVYADYGMEGLGFETQIRHDGNAIGYNEITGEFEQVAPFTPFKPNYTLNTFTFESPYIPRGNDTHYNPSTLGHSRTFTTKENPDILHVMESQSDWGQQTKDLAPKFSFKRAENGNTNVAFDINGKFHFVKDGEGMPYKDFMNLDLPREQMPHTIAKNQFVSDYKIEQVKHLHDKYLQRQLQENLRYAAENGLTKMRYPTPETAAKIEGYTKQNIYKTPEGKIVTSREALEYPDLNITRDLRDDLAELAANLRQQGIRPSTNQLWIRMNAQLEELASPKLKEGFLDMGLDYPLEHLTILKKYADFPKLFLKLFKGLQVRVVTDAKGNTWYEVDVPKDYLNLEWQYKLGGTLTTRKH